MFRKQFHNTLRLRNQREVKGTTTLVAGSPWTIHQKMSRSASRSLRCLDQTKIASGEEEGLKSATGRDAATRAYNKRP